MTAAMRRSVIIQVVVVNVLAAHTYCCCRGPTVDVCTHRRGERHEGCLSSLGYTYHMYVHLVHYFRCPLRLGGKKSNNIDIIINWLDGCCHVAFGIALALPRLLIIILSLYSFRYLVAVVWYLYTLHLVVSNIHYIQDSVERYYFIVICLRRNVNERSFRVFLFSCCCAPRTRQQQQQPIDPSSTTHTSAINSWCMRRMWIPPTLLTTTVVDHGGSEYVHVFVRMFTLSQHHQQ